MQHGLEIGKHMRNLEFLSNEPGFAAILVAHGGDFAVGETKKNGEMDHLGDPAYSGNTDT